MKENEKIFLFLVIRRFVVKPISAKRISTSKKEKCLWQNLFSSYEKIQQIKQKTKHKRQKANGVNLSYFSTTKNYL